MVDVNFDNRTDSNGRDPDIYSPTLRASHQVLWSKKLPNGQDFKLDSPKGKYLEATVGNHTFSMSSDSISNSFRSHAKLRLLIAEIDATELDEFQFLGSTVGAKTIFPSERRDRRPTINGARGLNIQIADRFDLTLECIRRHYSGGSSPLSETLERYSDFFELFETFEGYSNFFFFQDLLDTESENVQFFLPFSDGFNSPVLPSSVGEYMSYKRRTCDFIQRRNQRMQRWVQENPGTSSKE